MLGTLSTFGTNLVLLAEVSREHSKRQHVLRYAIPSTLLCGTGLLVLYLVISLFVNGQGNIPIRVLLAIGITELLIQPLFGLPVAEHLALGRIARSQMLTTLPLLLRLIVAIGVFSLHAANPLNIYAYGYFLASLIALACALITMPAPWPALKSWRLPEKGEVRNAAGYAALAITAVGPTELDKTLASNLLPLEIAGTYAAGARVIGTATLPVIAMMLSALPRMFRDGHHHPERTARLLRWVFGATFAYSMALTPILWFIAPVFPWLFGAKYLGLGQMIHWLCIAIPGMALRLAAGSILMALGKPWMRAGFEMAGLVVLWVSSICLTASLGSLGMPLALACSEWVMAAGGAILIAYTWHSNAQKKHD